MRGRFFVVGVVGFLVPLAIAYPAATALVGLAPLPALLLAGVMALSSLGVACKVLSDMGQLRSPVGLEVFTAVALLELVGLLVVGVLIQFAAPATPSSGLALAAHAARMVAFVFAAWFLGARVVPWLLRSARRFLGVRELPFGLVIGLLLGVVYLAEISGLHGTLGALLLGVAFSTLPASFQREVLPGVRSLAHGLFIPLFFAFAGLQVDLSFLALGPAVVLGLVAAVVGGKALGAMAGTRLARLATGRVVAVGLLAKGAVELALLTSLLELGIIPHELYAFLVLLMVLFLLAWPFLFRRVLPVAPQPPEVEAGAALSPVYARQALARVRSGDIMSPDFETVPADSRVSEFVEAHLEEPRRYYVVTDETGSMVGLVSLQEVQRVPRTVWDQLDLRSVAIAPPVLALPDEPLSDLLEAMAEHNFPWVPVVDPLDRRRVLGVITRSEVLHTLTRSVRRGEAEAVP